MGSLPLLMEILRENFPEPVDIQGAFEYNASRIDRGTAEFLNKVVNLNLVYDEPEEEGEVDMCKAMEDYTKKMQIIGAINALTLSGQTVEQIIKLVMENYHVSKAYVEDLMDPISA